jgi:hypothetical protein
MAIKCGRCDTPVVFTDVSPNYFAVCPEHDEDLYSYETYNDDQRAINILEGAIQHFVRKGQSTIPLGILNDILDQLAYTNTTAYVADEESGN